MKYLVIILSALFVIISCTPKDRTARINEIYEELEKEVADETKDESKTPDENLEPDDEQVEEDIEIIDELDEDAVDGHDEDTVDDSDVIKISGAICTGQTKCYNETEEIPCPAEGQDFYGQDAQYLDKCIPRSYSISGTSPEEIVTDNNTGLQWQRTISPDEHNWSESEFHCNNLFYGGYEDWRLPTVEELSSIIFYKNETPLFFEFFNYDETLCCYWTSFIVKGSYSSYWAVNFHNGDVGWSNGNLGTICVRGNIINENDYEELTVENDTTIKYSKNNLLWTQNSSEKLNWKDALKYCESLDYAGFSDWRLPNFIELKSLIDWERNYPASNFPEIKSEPYWTSTSAFYDNYAIFVNFERGQMVGIDKNDLLNLICVR